MHLVLQKKKKKRIARYQLSPQSLNVVIILLLLEKPPCQVLQRRGVKSPFQLQPKFLYQIRGEALILGLQDIHPVASEHFSALLSAHWPMNLGMQRWAFAALLWVCDHPWAAAAADKHPVSVMVPPPSSTAEIVCLWWTAEICVGHKAPFVSHRPSRLFFRFSKYRQLCGPEGRGHDSNSH